VNQLAIEHLRALAAHSAQSDYSSVAGLPCHGIEHRDAKRRVAGLAVENNGEIKSSFASLRSASRNSARLCTGAVRGKLEIDRPLRQWKPSACHLTAIISGPAITNICPR
jgi:hypothetical protein